jgi:hypothetical protein
MSGDETAPLREKLENAERRLEAALGEVCEDAAGGGSVRKPTTGELVLIDHTLAVASEAAKQAIALRRRLRANSEGKGDEGRRSETRAD